MEKKPTNLLRVLTYHRIAEIDDRPWLNTRIISATPSMFAQQMNFLSKKFHVVSMENVLDSVRKNKCLPKRAVLITFDDAYRDFAENAWPILKRLNMPATIFVPTAYPDHPERLFWWDKLYQVFINDVDAVKKAVPVDFDPVNNPVQRRKELKKIQNYLKSLPYEEAMTLVDEVYDQSFTKPSIQPTVLSWDELRKLSKEGVTLGAHTQTHPLLTSISVDRAHQEISGSYNDLQREIGVVLPVFCYPDCRHNDEVVNIIKNEGFLLGFNGPGGYNDLSSVDLFRIRRINITPKSSQFIFKLRLTSWFSFIEKFRLRKRIREITSTIELN